MNQDPNSRLRLLVEVGDGRAASAILENGFLGYCVDAGAEVHVLSPGARFLPFVDRYSLPGVRFSYLSVDTLDQIGRRRLVWREARFGRWLWRHDFHRTRRGLWRLTSTACRSRIGRSCGT